MHFCILSHFCITKCTCCLFKRAEAPFVKLGSKDLFLSSTRPCHLEACTLSLNSWVSYFFIKLKTKWSPKGKGQILFGGFFKKINEGMKHAKAKWSYGNRFELTGIRFSFFFTVKELTYIGPAVPLSGNTIKTEYRLQQNTCLHICRKY